MNKTSSTKNYEQISSQARPDMGNGDSVQPETQSSAEFLRIEAPALFEQISSLPDLDLKHSRSERFEYGGSIIDFTQLQTEKMSLAITEDRSVKNVNYLIEEAVAVIEAIDDKPGYQVFVHPEGEIKAYSLAGDGERHLLSRDETKAVVEDLKVELPKLRARMLEHNVEDIDQSEKPKDMTEINEYLRQRVGKSIIHSVGVEAPAEALRR